MYACTVELYDILKGKNVLVKSVYCITEYSICNLVCQLEHIVEIFQYVMLKVKGKVHCRRFREGVEELLYAFFNLSARSWWAVDTTSRVLCSLYRGQAGPKCGLDRCR
jgi:hypothetical protein